MQDFINELKYIRNVSLQTLALYSYSFKAFENALDSKADVLARIAKLRDGGLSPVSVNTYTRCLNAYFNWKHTERGQERIKIPRLKTEIPLITTFSETHISRIIKHRPEGMNQSRALMLALLILDTGLRIKEARLLKRTDIDFDSLIISAAGKGGKYRRVPMSIELRKRLYRFFQSHTHSAVFATRFGTAVTQRNALRDFIALCKEIQITGVRCSWHTLRHTFAVNYLRRGGNVFYLSRILGHSDIKTTQIYLRSIGVEDFQKVHDGLSMLSR